MTVETNTSELSFSVSYCNGKTLDRRIIMFSIVSRHYKTTVFSEYFEVFQKVSNISESVRKVPSPNKYFKVDVNKIRKF